jgi:hypothetical protein
VPAEAAGLVWILPIFTGVEERHEARIGRTDHAIGLGGKVKMSRAEASFLIACGDKWYGALYGKTKNQSPIVVAMAASLPEYSSHGRRRSIDAGRTGMSEGDYKTREGILSDVNGFLTNTCKIEARAGVSVFKASDPLVYVGGKAYKYHDIVGAATQKDAADFITWYTSDALTLANLPPHIQALAIIVCFAEVARGFKASIELELGPWLTDIVRAGNELTAGQIWKDVNARFKASTTYAQDQKVSEDWRQ